METSCKWSREVRRGALLLYHSRLIALSTRRKLILLLLYYPTGKGKNFSLPGYSLTNDKTVTIQPMKATMLFSGLSVPSLLPQTDFNSLSQLPLLLYKRMFSLLLFSGLACGLQLIYASHIVIFCCS